MSPGVNTLAISWKSISNLTKAGRVLGKYNNYEQFGGKFEDSKNIVRQICNKSAL